jgi:rhamnose utilization protein RhaD (predicted bifunctional aldolase and dehydrogenase)
MTEVRLAYHTQSGRQAELQRLLDLTQRVGNDPLLTQASTGNSSVKLDDILWIKASGKWMADAVRDDIFISLNLSEVVRDCVRRRVDPAVRYRGASLETALHAVLPHRMVLHLHCVDTIAWAVRRDGPVQLQRLLEGLPWQWIPYTASGLSLSGAIELALSTQARTDLFVLGNHGLVVCGENAAAIEDLLNEVRRRVAIHPRKPHPPDYAALREMARNSPWDLPDDDAVHALGTDTVSQAILGRGVLYPCQTIFSGSGSSELFRAIPYPYPGDSWQHRYSNRPFLIVENRGVIVSRTIAPSELAMISGLAQVVQRLNTAVPLRYLSDTETAGITGQTAYHYRELASARHGLTAR